MKKINMMFTRNSKVSTKVQRYTAFTLAEVLITLGIIGVVAALTLPIIKKNSQTEQFRSGLKKQYSVLSEAISLLQTQNGSIDTSTGTNFVNDLLTQLKVLKTGTWNSLSTLPSDFYYHCYKNTSGTCGNYLYKSAYGGNRAFITSDGALYIINLTNTNCTGGNYTVKVNPSDSLPASGLPANNLCAAIFLDLNGDKGPNQSGVDLHQFMLIKYNEDYLIRPTGTNLTSLFGCSSSYPENFNMSAYCSIMMLLGKKMP